MQDYRHYHFTIKEWLRYSIEGMGIITILGYLFYQHFAGIVCLTPLLFLYLKRKKGSLAKERKWKLNLEFMDGLQALSAALEAGYSAEHSLEEAYRDLLLIYSENTMILHEFKFMINQIQLNIPVEKALEDLGVRSGVEDIRNFAEVFGTAKRTGGDLVQIIKISRDILCDKIEVKREIVTMISAKRLEANIMRFIPLFILVYLLITSPDFLKPLYHNPFGIFLMSIFLTLYFLGFLMIDRIISIEV